MVYEMVGLPPILTFRWFHDIYPCRLWQRNVHHLVALWSLGWLMTVGADKPRALWRAVTRGSVAEQLDSEGGEVEPEGSKLLIGAEIEMMTENIGELGEINDKLDECDDGGKIGEKAQ